LIPTVVRYAKGEFEVDPRSLLERRHMGPIPLDWTRHQFVTDGNYSDMVLTTWLTDNMHGRFSVSSTSITKGFLVVVGFEQVNDAVMFRLMDGETAWQESQLVQIT